MREMLFRAKRIDNGEWVEGYYVYDYAHNAHFILKNQLICPNCINDRRIDYSLCDYEINPETLCQFTGLKDKNGNRIWENDIVSAWSEGKYATGMVKQRIDGLYIIYPAYQHNEFWRLCPDKNRKTNVEVIGNVFDDKNLLDLMRKS